MLSLPGTPERTLTFAWAVAAMPYGLGGAERIHSYTIKGGEALMLRRRPTAISYDCPKAGYFGIPLPEREPLNEWPFL